MVLLPSPFSQALGRLSFQHYSLMRREARLCAEALSQPQEKEITLRRSSFSTSGRREYTLRRGSFPTSGETNNTLRRGSFQLQEKRDNSAQRGIPRAGRCTMRRRVYYAQGSVLCAEGCIPRVVLFLHHPGSTPPIPPG